MNRLTYNNLFQIMQHGNFRDLNRVSFIQKPTFAGDQFTDESLVGVLIVNTGRQLFCNKPS